MIFAIKKVSFFRDFLKERWMFGVILFGLLFFFERRYAFAGYDLDSNPNVYWTSDRMAFTTDRGEKNYVKYPFDMVIPVGERRHQYPGVGEHVYLPKETDDISLSQWRVTYTPGHCIHQNSVTEYHGVAFNREICKEYYKCGWYATCADCGEEIRLLFYMDMETAMSITKLPAGKDYYYACPHCGHMEIGAKISHICSRVSANKYYIAYRKNARDATGYMEVSVFYYNNATEYEGSRVYGERQLRNCGFERPGYVLVGWNTMPDGSGQSFSDCELIYNLSAVQNDEIVLYAQWKRPDSTLCIDPNGGSYEGNTGLTTVTKGYGESYQIAKEKIGYPMGYQVSFNAGEQCFIPSVLCDMTFDYFQMSQPVHGTFVDDMYSFTSIGATVDQITLQYKPMAIVLPQAYAEGYIFEGWYLEPQGITKVGSGGDLYTPFRNTILYAKWSEQVGLTANLSRILEPHDPIFACGESGYIDLHAWGHIERLEVKFPEEFLKYDSKLNRTFDYVVPEKQRWERLQFMVPLQTKQNEQYTVMVYAYKHGLLTEDSPVHLTLYVRGSILEELRTRLR